MKKSWIMTASLLIIVGFIGLVIAKFDVSEKKLVDFEHEFEFLDNITVEDFTVLGSSSNVNINFIASENNSTFITIEGMAEATVIEKIKQASLIDAHFKLDIVRNETFRLLTFGDQGNKLNITLSLPNNQILNQLQLDMKSGNINVNELTAKSGTIEVNSGKVTVTNSEVDSLIVNALSGNIDIDAHKGKLAVKVASGNINIDQLTGSSEIESTSGKIILTQHDNQGAMINAKSGNVEVRQYQASDAHIKVISGNVKLTVAEDFAGFYDLKATSGVIEAPESLRESKHLVKVRTTSGNIKISRILNVLDLK